MWNWSIYSFIALLCSLVAPYTDRGGNQMNPLLPYHCQTQPAECQPVQCNCAPAIHPSTHHPPNEPQQPGKSPNDVNHGGQYVLIFHHNAAHRVAEKMANIFVRLNFTKY